MLSPHEPDHEGAPRADRPPYAEIVVDAHTTIPGDRFTYAAPKNLDLRPGHLVRVPFGQRTIYGVVVRLTHETSLDYVKPVLGLLHPQPVVDAVRLELAEWVAAHYLAPSFDAVAPFLPPGFRARARPSIALRPHALDRAPDIERLARGARRLLTYLSGTPRPHQIAQLTRTLGPWVPNAARALIQSGLAEERVAEPRLRPASRSVRVVRPMLASADMLERADRMSRAPKQAALARRLAEPTAAPYAASRARAEFGAAAVTALVNKGLAEIAATGPTDAPSSPVLGAEPARAGRRTEPPLLPTPAQQAALQRVTAALDDATVHPRTFLLHGVTGSGKTEVYLQALARCLALGKRAIVLVSELALTPQTVQRFEARFPGQVGLLHSSLTHNRAWGEWWAIHGSERGVVVGPRSALFAPQPDLGLIILDEEHEWTYKQVDQSPRYHARDVAIELARLTSAVVVLGSATPDVVSAHRAERGAYALLRLPSRIDRSGAPASLATVRVVDMRDELKAGNRGVFSRALEESLRSTIAAGRQAILFLNRRGSGGIVECRDCGHPLRCPRCGTPYTLHGPGGGSPADASRPGRSGAALVCHHCNRRRRMPSTCPDCHSPRIRSLGLGTQRLVEEVRVVVPEARVLRWDRDAASSPAAHAALLERFESGEADVLVGTQMIAKGLDIPSVTLVGVVLADLGLHLPDFRAPERTFQLLTQVAGRAGRGSSPGDVVIQTYAPEHYAVAAAAAQDYDSFYLREMHYRRPQGNPPFGKLIRLVFAHGDERAARVEAQRLAAALRRAAREWDMSEVDVGGPAPAYPPRARGAWRWHVIVRGPEPRLLLDKIAVPAGWTVDVDPQSVV